MNREEILARSRAEQNDEGMRDAEEKGRRIGIRAFCLVEVIVLLFPLPGVPHSVRPAGIGGCAMDESLVLKNRLKEVRIEKGISQAQLAQLVGVSRNTISSIETGQFNPTAKLALILCIALDKKFEELFYFDA